ANNVSGIQFLMDDMAALRDRARSESIAKAKKQAEDLAEELGMSLGKLTSYGEDISSFPDTGYGKGGYGGGGGTVMAEGPVPIGEQEFTLRVYLTYELR
ncbi:MAG: hypothetical protein UY90_C0002G0020, partial [Candidatus Peregrinibacteria bacterium GW2011_GWA2_54_9]